MYHMDCKTSYTNHFQQLVVEVEMVTVAKEREEVEMGDMGVEMELEVVKVALEMVAWEKVVMGILGHLKSKEQSKVDR